MKTASFFFALCVVFSLSSCNKFEWLEKDKDHDKEVCGFGEMEGDKDDLSSLKEIVYKDIKYGDKCACPTEGAVKYMKDNKTVALVDYGQGDCDNIAVKTVCVNGDCEHPEAEVFEFEMDCSEYDSSNN